MSITGVEEIALLTLETLDNLTTLVLPLYLSNKCIIPNRCGPQNRSCVKLLTSKSWRYSALFHKNYRAYSGNHWLLSPLTLLNYYPHTL